MKKQNKGFTLVELLLATAMVAVVIGALALMFQVAAGGWSTQGVRIGAGVSATKAVREMVRDLRGAKEIGSQNSNELRFTKDSVTYFIYYLYNAADSYPSAFTKTSYQMRKATLSGGIGGTFAYGSGDLIARDILPPPVSELSLNAPVITIDLSIQRGNSTMRSADKVKLRNM